VGQRALLDRLAAALWRAGAGQIGDDGVELAVGASGEYGPETFVELLGKQPPLNRGATEPLGYRFTIRI
jgi:hypothetical protein